MQNRDWSQVDSPALFHNLDFSHHVNPQAVIHSQSKMNIALCWNVNINLCIWLTKQFIWFFSVRQLK